MGEKVEKRRNERSHYGPVWLAAGLAILIIGFHRIAPILLSLILVLLIFLALNPVIVWLRRISGGRLVATGLVVLTFLGLLILTGWAFFAPVKKSTSKFVERLPDYWERVQKPIVKMEHRAVISEQKLKREVTTEVAKENNQEPSPTPVEPPVEAVAAQKTEEQPGMVNSGVRAVLGGVTGFFKTLASNFMTLVMVLVTVFVGVIFSLLNPRPVLGAFFSFIPEKHHDTAVRISQRVARFVPRWALATLLGMFCIGLLTFFCMWPLFGFHDALVLGLIAMIFEAVPYVGPFLAGIPAVLLGMGEGGLTPLWVVLIYIGIQAVENNIVAPVIVGGQLRLHPVGVIFAVLVTASIFGVLGVLIGMPMLAIGRIIHQELFRPKYLPATSDEDLELLARRALNEKGLTGSAGPIKPQRAETLSPGTESSAEASA